MVVEVYNDLCDIYETDRQRPHTEVWPPNQPLSIVNLALIHYQNIRTQQEVIEFSKRCIKEGASCVDKLDSHPNVTKDIKELFKSDGATETRPPKRILIEGAPGIGKTILTKEIAYQWANDEILKEYKLVFLLYLRDPKVHEVQSVKEILELFVFENTPELNAYIKKRRGKNVAFLLDGFDEYPVALQRKSFITDLIKCENDGKLFLNSAVIVTSRPTATLFLHNIVDRRIKILGFPKEERDKYVSMSLKDSPNKTQKLDEYLKKHPIINSVCYVPLHLAILVYRFKQGSLPETLTEMNESFIVYTIYHYLKKKGLSSHDDVVNKLTDLPENVIKFVYKLANLAFSGLENNQLVFSLDEIKKNCREVDDINGLGLLQAVQHYPKKGAGSATSVNFLHFTMQEYLAALHVSTHPSWLQLSLMERTFWDGKFNFMWMMYVGIVGVKSEGFASFIASNEWHIMSDDIPDDYSIKDNICNDKLKCLHLFQCYMEAKSDAEMPEEISSIFTSNAITLSGMTLLPHHISSLIFFMSASSMQWQILNLGNCNLGDVGVNSLLEHVIKNDQNLLSLEYVDLSGNCSSPWGVYCAIIRHCCVNSLTLYGDEGMEEYVKEITDCLQTNATLQSLTLCKIGRTGVESIENILANSTNTALKELNLSWGSHSKGTKIVSTNLKLLPHSNERVINVNILYDRSCEYLPEAIICSHSRIDDNAVCLLSLGLYNNTKVKKFDLFHNYITSIGMNKLSKSIKHSISLEYVDLSGNCSSPWGVYCAIIRHCCVNSLTLCGDEGMKKYVREIRDSLQSNTKLQSLTLCTSRRYKNMILEASNILVIDEKLFVDTAFNSNRNLALNCNGRVVSIKIVYADSNCERSCIGWSTHTYCDCNRSMPDKTSDCTYDSDSDWDHLHEVDLSYSSFSCNSTRFDKVKIYNNDYKCLFESIDLSHKDINDDTLCLISFGLCNSTTVQILDLSCNRITDDGAVIISDCFKGNYSLHTLILSRNRISYKGTKEIAEMIKVNKVIQKLDMSCNNISDDGAVAISESLKTNNVLQELSLSNNQITSKGAKKIAEALRANKCLHKLDISHNSICDDGIIHISNSLKENNTLQELNLSKSGVSIEGARIIAEALYTLKKFSISM